MVIQQSMGENEYGKSGHLSISPSLKHLMMLLKGNSFRAFFLYTLWKTLIACRAMQLKMETLLKPMDSFGMWWKSNEIIFLYWVIIV